MKKILIPVILAFSFLNTSCASIATNISERKEISVENIDNEKSLVSSNLKPHLDIEDGNNLKVKINLEKNYILNRNQTIKYKKESAWIWSFLTLGVTALATFLLPIWNENNILIGVGLTATTGFLADLIFSFNTKTDIENKYLGKIESSDLVNLSFNKVILTNENNEEKSEYSTSKGDVIFKNIDDFLTDSNFLKVDFNNDKLVYKILKSDLFDNKKFQTNNNLDIDVDNNIPQTKTSNRNGIAIIIGNRDYQNKDIPKVEYAIRDARSVKKYIKDTLGYKEENITYIENASSGQFNALFGNKDNPNGKLSKIIEENKSEVFIYYSGHGAPDLDTKSSYFVPVDTEADSVAFNGYSLETFYNNLSKLKAKNITVIIDSCFSGASGDGKMIIKNASPLFIDVKNKFNLGSNIDVLTSSSGKQISSWYAEKKHSLFTYYFLKAIQLGNKEDEDNINPDINRDNKLNLEEIYSYINTKVKKAANKIYGREQTPEIISKDIKKIIIGY